MQLAANKPTVWLSTKESTYNTLRFGGYGEFLSDARKCRLERIRQARMLFDGQHREYFLDERRTQFESPKSLINGETITNYSAFNVLGLTARKFADLLFGEAPVLSCDDAIQKQRLDELVKRCKLPSLLHGVATDCCYEGEAFLEAVLWNGQVWLRQVESGDIFPEGELQPDGQYASYVRYALDNAGTDALPIWMLLVVRYTAGRIERSLHQLGDQGQIVRSGLDLSAWPAAARGDAPLLEAVQETGIEQNTIVWVPNALVRGQAVSDFDGSPLKLQDQLNAQDTQLADLLAKHARPMVAVPRPAADDSGNNQARHRLWYFDPANPEAVPKYITRDLQVEAAIAGGKRTLSNLLIDLEMSAVLLGLQEGGTPDAWRKLKLNAQNALKKAARKAAYWSAAVAAAAEVAQSLEQTIPGARYDRLPIAAEIRDGIPDDPVDRANEQATLRGAGLLSRRRALMQQMGDAAAVEAELSELDEEEEAKTPSVLLGETGEQTTEARRHGEEQTNTDMGPMVG